MRQGRTVVVVVTLALAGLLAPSRAGTAAEPLPDSRLGVRTVPLLLLSRRDVQADLSMTAEQVADAARAIDDLRTRALQLRGKSGDDAVRARRAIDEAQQRWIEERLNETQRVRVVQIDLQWEGASALVSRASMSEALALSPRQIDQLRQLAAAAAQQRQDGGAAFQAQHHFAVKALEILTESQRKSWKAMLGKPFVPKLATDQTP